MMAAMEIALLTILLLAAWLVLRAASTGPLPAPGTRAPEFSLPDQHGTRHALADHAGRWLVLYFYPRNGTPVCTREACAFRDGQARLRAAGAAVIGVSVDSQASHARFAASHGLGFPLLADTEGQVARRYGVLVDFKIWRMAKRHTFLIDPQGKVQKVFTRIDPSRHADEIIAELNRLAR